MSGSALGSAPPGLGRRRNGEAGGSVVMFVATLPVLFAFLCAIVDLGRVVFLGIALCDAAHEACRVASGLPVAAVSEEDLLDAALQASPALAGEGLRLSASVSYGDAEDASYVHHAFDEASGTFQERLVRTRRRSVSVELELSGSFLTPVGDLVAAADGGALALGAQARGLVGESEEGAR